MARSRRPADSPLTIRGEVARVTLSVYLLDEEHGEVLDYSGRTLRSPRRGQVEARLEYERVLDDLREQESTLRSEISKEVRRRLGEDFYVRRLEIRPGSIEILLVISTVFSMISYFNEIVGGVRESIENARWLVQDVVGQVVRPGMRALVDAAWTPGAAIAASADGVTGAPMTSGFAFDYSLVGFVRVVAIPTFFVALAIGAFVLVRLIERI